MTAPLEHGQLPDCHLQQIHVDVVGPLPISQGNTTGGYHPQAKGIVERFHRQLKAALSMAG